MSSHWEWAEEQMRVHDAERRFAPENGQPLRFAPGDVVIFTNDAGIEFTQAIVGIYERPGTACGLYASGGRYYLEGMPHFPVQESKLRPIPKELAEERARYGSW